MMQYLRSGLLVLLLCSVLGAYAQDETTTIDPSFNQFSMSQLFYNPAYAGNMGGIHMSAIGRTEFTSGNLTSAVSLDTDLDQIHGGVGANFMFRNRGNEQDLLINAAYAYHLDVGPGTLAIGLSGGIASKRWITNVSGGATPTNPNQVAGVSQSETEFAFGVHYDQTNFWAGVSTTHFNEPVFDQLGPFYRWYRNTHTMAGLNIESGEAFIRPSAHFFFTTSNDAGSGMIDNGYDLNFTVAYQDRFWGGIVYRGRSYIQQAWGLTGGFGFENNLRIGYSFDRTRANTGILLTSHEFVLSIILSGPKDEE